MGCDVQTDVLAAFGAIVVIVWGVKTIRELLGYVQEWRRSRVHIIPKDKDAA